VIDTIHASVNRLARRQRGVVTRRQLLDLGIASTTIARWLRQGRLERLHRGVYRLTATRRSEVQDVMAAVLAVGGQAHVSHVTAAALWDLADIALAAPHHVTSSRRCQRMLTGVAVHWSELNRLDRTTLGGIPVTMVPRTVIDTAGLLETQEDVDDLVLEAIRRRRASPSVFDAALDRANGIAGTGPVRASLERFDPAVARRLLSRAETIALATFRDGGLPRPDVNRRLFDDSGAIVARVDFSWLDGLVVVEIDGLRFHSTARQKRYDDARQNELVLSGRIVLRFSLADFDEPARVVDQVSRALALARSR
jgi:hypothetical protein